MKEYETIYILKPDLAPDQLNVVKEKAVNTIKKGQGHILVHADWGKRRLAYDVEKFHHAQYLYISYIAPGNVVGELERILKFDDQVLKFLSVKLHDQVNVEERLARESQAPEAPEEMDYSPVRDSGPYRDNYGDSRRDDDGGYGDHDNTPNLQDPV